MPYKDKEKQKEAQRRHYLKNKDKFKQRIANRRNQNKIYAHSLKTECSICGINDSRCLDFHNIKEKNKTIAQLICDGTIAKIKSESEKYIILCGNCHRKHHLPIQIKDGSEWKNFNSARVKKRKWFIEFISNQKCNRCQENDSRCLEFHHIKEKRFTIGYLLTSGHSLSFLQEELERCEVLCTNCHRIEHTV